MTTATLTLSSDPDNLDMIQLSADYHGDFDPTSTAHVTIDYLRSMLEVQSERALEAANAPAEAPSKLILPAPPTKRGLILATNGGKRGV